MAGDVGGELLSQQLREVALQRSADPRVFGQVGVHQLIKQPHLAVGQQHGQFGAGQADAAGLAGGDFFVVGQVFDRPVELPLLFQEAHEARLLVDEAHTEAGGDRECLRLEIVVAQDQGCDVVGQLRQQAVALLFGQLAVAQRQAEQDLDVDLVVGRVDTGRVVDCVRVQAHPRQGRLDAPALRKAQIAALADHLAAQLCAVDAQAVVGTVAHFGMCFGACLDIGADAAVVEQVDRRLEDGHNQLRRRQPLCVDVERRARLGRQRDRLFTARPDATTFGDQRGVAVGPGRAWQLEQAFALGERGGSNRCRVDEDVAVIERGQQPDVP